MALHYTSSDMLQLIRQPGSPLKDQISELERRDYLRSVFNDVCSAFGDDGPCGSYRTMDLSIHPSRIEAILADVAPNLLMRSSLSGAAKLAAVGNAYIVLSNAADALPGDLFLAAFKQRKILFQEIARYVGASGKPQAIATQEAIKATGIAPAFFDQKRSATQLNREIADVRKERAAQDAYAREVAAEARGAQLRARLLNPHCATGCTPPAPRN